MSSDYAISIQNLNKVYHVYNKPQDRLKQSLLGKKKQYYREFWALNDVSFEVKKGETVGIIGQNGSGKSTLLQIIAGTLNPTGGKVSVNGRVAALLELGSGFNPEFTGRENVYMNGAILGISKEEMEKRFEEITVFADIGDFIDQPVKTYSSGMYVRLAFAVSVNVNADILIIDEALAVGDTRFQMKCIEKMKELQKRDVTIIFVSHAPEQIKRFCQKSLWLEKGKVVMLGNANDVVNDYEDSMNNVFSDNIKVKEKETIEHEKSLELKSKAAFISEFSCSSTLLDTYDKFELEICYRINDTSIPTILIGVAIYGNDRKYIFGPNTHLDKVKVPNTMGEHKIIYRIPKVPLLAGSYFIDIGLFTDAGLVCLDYKLNALEIHVKSEYFTEGLVHIDHDWEVVKG